MSIDTQLLLKMNSTSIHQSVGLNSSHQPIKATVENPQPRRKFSKSWLLLPLFTTPFLVAASSFSGILYAHQSSSPARQEVAEPVTTTTASSVELELALNERDMLEQKYHATVSQLHGTQDLHAELQIAYQDAQDFISSLKRQNQQLQVLAAERSPLLAEIEQLEETKQKLDNQIHTHQQQLSTLKKRLDGLEKDKQKLTQDNQQLQLAAKELNTLKPELEQALWKIAQLSNQLNQKPEEMVKITINDKPFLVPQELAVAIDAERQQHPVKDNSAEAEQQASAVKDQE
jgi:chromosome segregation ATPase